jgi:hypothetical protein
MQKTVYVDLFDDGIPTRNPLLNTGDFKGRLLDVVRFQVLLSLLMGRSVVVPEACSCASPTKC